MFNFNLEDLKEEAEEIRNNLELIKKKLNKQYKDTDNTELFNQLDTEYEYINNMVSMIISNKEDQDKLNKALMFFLEEYEGKVDNIEKIIEEEINKRDILGK
tara:strand:+ start:65 stop:370 length:306 start_codon:yes stop_codon:yes gene_type:complete